MRAFPDLTGDGSLILLARALDPARAVTPSRSQIVAALTAGSPRWAATPHALTERSVRASSNEPTSHQQMEQAFSHSLSVVTGNPAQHNGDLTISASPNEGDQDLTTALVSTPTPATKGRRLDRRHAGQGRARAVRVDACNFPSCQSPKKHATGGHERDRSHQNEPPAATKPDQWSGRLARRVSSVR